MCACRGCYLLFTADGAGGSRFRAVPETYRSLPDVRLSAARWDAMQVPVGVAFFFLNYAVGQVAAIYPMSVADALESGTFTDGQFDWVFLDATVRLTDAHRAQVDRMARLAIIDVRDQAWGLRDVREATAERLVEASRRMRGVVTIFATPGGTGDSIGPRPKHHP